jgi:DNA-binding beta-propeller fold protein YncE
VRNVGENPAAIVLSPDGKRAVVANHAGELLRVRDDRRSGNTLASATLAVVDIDPSSPSYLSVLTWIKNR